MKNKYLIATFFSTFLLMAPNVKAANFMDNQVVDTNKSWTIKFTQEIKFDDLTKQNITVTDSKGTRVNAGIKLGEDNNTVIVTAPQNGYIEGESYILNVGTKVHSNKGKGLKKEQNVHFNIKNNNSIVKFKDKYLEEAVRYVIMKPEGTIYKSDVEKITYLDAKSSGIQNIEGLEKLTNLEKIDLSFNSIENISALKGLTKLKTLNLSFNWSYDGKGLEALGESSNLENLDLTSDRVGDISALKKFAKLKTLNLQDNRFFEDISALGGLTNLQTLNLRSNEIKDISALKGLINLKTLDLGGNQIKDISPLKRLINLTEIDLSYNQISDISALEGLTNLKQLKLSNNKFKNITPLKKLTNLEYVQLINNQINDVDKKALKDSLPKCTFKYCYE
ncbi:leucine-rich repeat domain-containing protein [Clostridium sp. MB40-C1]|uniref:leucine-rich repeat domain-containing protein n=1 Tax=Clostridium sp. MB40-C1 TaxID=3070996 RepID=UPI0027DFE8E5|nr:leucine-rich repeat domain-containing protein [Clostridium sp. MB40-C1]WMJ79839.1 leucine-rich repeat domain-containing protein [Clostridium sp. MB40-C1]